jgi:tetratricopeptide (TPR) repeat protein
MTLNGTSTVYSKILIHLSKGEVKDALDALSLLIPVTQNSDYSFRHENISETYSNILKYTVENVKDPERQKIYNRMMVSLYELADNVFQYLLTQKSELNISRLKKELDRAGEWINDEEDQNLPQVFNVIWLTDRFAENDIRLINTIRNSSEIAWFEKSIVVSALTLSLLRTFDHQKLELLIDFYEDGQEQVWQRALVGIIIGMYLFDDRIRYYPVLPSRLSLLKDKEGFQVQVGLVIIQLLRSKETERLTKRLQEEILPEVAKLAPRLEERLDIESLTSRDPMDDKNPDWEDFFRDTPDLYSKMEEFTNLQMEGSDVFWSAFAMLKHFDFFRQVHNWFLPFHKENNQVKDVFLQEIKSNDPELFLDGIERSAFLCNSDKYSFCLNIRNLPEKQKSLLFDFFGAELRNLNEMTDEDNLIHKTSRDKFIFAQYIQDLYRFYKLHPFRSEFTDIFNLDLDIHDSRFALLLFDDTAVIKNSGEFYFEKDHYRQALNVYLALNNKGENSYEIFEKIGYCYQRLKQYDKAVEFYLKAELYDTNRIWLLKKIAFCYKNLKKFDEAIAYFQEVLRAEPDNSSILASIGYCYLDKKEEDRALEYFLKVELLHPDDIIAMRPVAWIHFIQGRLKVSAGYYKQIISEGPNRFDYMNMGHVCWCRGDVKSAVNYYRSSVLQKDNTFDQFLAGFEADREYLAKHGIRNEDICLVIDFLRYQLPDS